MRLIGELPTPAVYTVGTPVTTVPMSCSFVFKNSMILVADVFDKGSCPAVASPFVFSRNIFCPATVPGLKLPVNGFFSKWLLVHLLLLLPCLCLVEKEVEKAVARMNCCEGFLT